MTVRPEEPQNSKFYPTCMKSASDEYAFTFRIRISTLEYMKLLLDELTYWRFGNALQTLKIQLVHRRPRDYVRKPLLLKVRSLE